MENVKTVYEDRPVKWMVYPAILFMVLGMTVGTFLAFNTFLFPDYFSGEYIHFGRVRPVHVGTVTLLSIAFVTIVAILFMLTFWRATCFTRF